MRKIIPIFIFVAIIAILFFSMAKKEQMKSVYLGNSTQKPLSLELSHLQDPYCKMVITDQDHAAQVAAKSGKTWIFDDIGCMILWLSDKDLPDAKLWVYAQDKKGWIRAQDAFYSVDEMTPMHHGFGAYATPKEGRIDYETMRKRVLHHEDLTNPIIRKKILGV